MSEMRPNSSALVGQTADGYVILKEIGVGAASVVYQAMEPLADNKLVAIKVLDRAERNLGDGREATNPFERELQIARRFREPGILRIFGTGELADGRFYMAMEFAQGMTLAEELQHRHTVPWLEAAETIEALAWSLTPLHEQGVVHRDITPGNVMVRMGKDKRIHTKLIDFGAAKLPGEWDEEGQGPVGTPRYMSPEQAGGRGATVRSDVYAMGVLLYEMLSGQSVFGQGRLSAETCQAYLAEGKPLPAVPLAQLAPEVPKPFVDFVNHALAADPGARPKDAFAFAHELDQAIDAARAKDKGASGWLRSLLGKRSS